MLSHSGFLAPLVGLEPTTCGLTVRRSTDWAKEECLCSRYLFSRQVTLQVSSAYMSLTSVFGMGTGGPSWQSIPTRMDGSLTHLLYVKSRLASNSKEIISPHFSYVKKNLVGLVPWKLNIVSYFAISGLVNTEPALDQAFGLLVSVS